MKIKATEVSTDDFGHIRISGWFIGSPLEKFREKLKKKTGIFSNAAEKTVRGKMSSTESFDSAPQLIEAFRKGPQAFGVAAATYARSAPMATRLVARDTAAEECLELLDHLVVRLGREGQTPCQGLEDACVFLLRHIAGRFVNPDACPEESFIH